MGTMPDEKQWFARQIEFIGNESASWPEWRKMEARALSARESGAAERKAASLEAYSSTNGNVRRATNGQATGPQT